MTRPLRDVPAHALLDALAAALDGTGPAVRPLASPDLGEQPDASAAAADVRPAATRARPVTTSAGPAAPRPAATQAAHVDERVAVVVRTSGSTGEPREVLLSGAALRASATATERRLGGPGRWLLALPTHHVAGLQVLARSVLAGTAPVVVPPGPFRPAAFVEAVTGFGTTDRRYASLVPTQLVRLLDDPAATTALTTFDAVLLGGAATAPDVLARAHAAGVRVVTTYGMTETCGGCVYDGVPLEGVDVTLDDAGRVLLSGPVLADGYRGRPDLDADAFVALPDGRRALRTHDLGRLDDGVLAVLGRADDVLVTGGAKVAPAAVEAVLAGLDGVREACVVGVPDAEWGQAVVAVVVPREGDVPTLDAVREAVARRLGPPSAPRHLLAVRELPLRGPGKVDRAAVTRLATDALGAGPTATDPLAVGATGTDTPGVGAAGSGRGAGPTSRDDRTTSPPREGMQRTTSTGVHDDAGVPPAPTGRSGA
ncbi:o-succinylbenzoate--CoA ligase [Cellulomonas fimi]|uniref:o-succinylbenzoate--CoA ligase n=1 Tax=Cellulomonas fimi TaxID=1708 RepID=UPI00234DD5D8|nr:o-succinylbenzoate--CoA ligase [Cellulomonas fimi]MDC7122225.1 o-succinylbenzoate--CoA ligase [Cellulomonas fimi]